MRAVIRHVLGWGSLLLGVAGLFLPGLQGLLLIATGAILLAPDVPIFARLVDWIEDRFPALRSGLQRLRERLGHSRRPQG
jgi:hypothetical protein